jgi:hypothetical protein
MIGSRVETRRFQAMGQLQSACTAPPRDRGSQRVSLVFVQHHRALGRQQSELNVSSQVKVPAVRQEVGFHRRRRQRNKAAQAANVNQRGGVRANGADHGADPRAAPHFLANVVDALTIAGDHVAQRPARDG